MQVPDGMIVLFPFNVVLEGEVEELEFEGRLLIWSLELAFQNKYLFNRVQFHFIVAYTVLNPESNSVVEQQTVDNSVELDIEVELIQMGKEPSLLHSDDSRRGGYHY